MQNCDFMQGPGQKILRGFSSDIPTSIEEIRDNFLKNIQSIPKITYYIFLRHQIHIFNPIPPSPQVIQFIYSTPHPLKLLEPKSTHVHRKHPSPAPGSKHAESGSSKTREWKYHGKMEETIEVNQLNERKTDGFFQY